jgi:radical SAM protein with 4Fe4S-binding SPASM domain
MVKKALTINTCFWELTRRCRLRCLHCRSQSGDADDQELDLPESLAIADQLVALKTRRVVLTGGEPVLYPGWDEIAKRLSTGGVRVRLFSSGYSFDAKTLGLAADAGVSEYALSLDGPRLQHDRIRPAATESGESSFAHAIAAIKLIVNSGANLRVVTQVNRINIDCLEDVYEFLTQLGVKRWQLHLCQMTGRAGDHRHELMCDPADLEKIIDVSLRAAKEKKMLVPMHCSVGYMTREEPILRGRGAKARPVWTGCRAGLRTIAITPTGGIKGCTTLPDEFITASLTNRSLDDIWSDDDCFPYTRNWSRDMLGGLCVDCAFAMTCRAGCPAVAYSATGSIGANPYCLRLVREKDE